MPRIAYEDFTITRRLMETEIEEALVPDINSYKIDICCFQEIKIKEAIKFKVACWNVL